MASDKRCKQCGTSNPPTAKFCRNCGNKFVVAQTPPSEPKIDKIGENVGSISNGISKFIAAGGGIGIVILLRMCS